jgi:hypothetical protein
MLYESRDPLVNQHFEHFYLACRDLCVLFHLSNSSLRQSNAAIIRRVLTRVRSQYKERHAHSRAVLHSGLRSTLKKQLEFAFVSALGFSLKLYSVN